jgi:thiamine-phosphate pyrophosphorylase
MSHRTRSLDAASLPYPLVVMVADTSRYAGDEAVVAATQTAARAGVDIIQIRAGKSRSDTGLLGLSQHIQHGCAGTSARTLVNDRVDVALAADLDGVHLPARAVDCQRVRAITPPGWLIGRSVHSLAEAVATEATGGCDYLIFGTVFASESKPLDHPVAGVDAVAEVCAVVRLPVIAIGGMTADRAALVARAGAAGVAAIGLFAAGSQNDLRAIVSRVRSAFGA